MHLHIGKRIGQPAIRVTRLVYGKKGDKGEGYCRGGGRAESSDVRPRLAAVMPAVAAASVRGRGRARRYRLLLLLRPLAERASAERRPALRPEGAIS